MHKYARKGVRSDLTVYNVLNLPTGSQHQQSSGVTIARPMNLGFGTVSLEGQHLIDIKSAPDGEPAGQMRPPDRNAMYVPLDVV